MRRPPLPLVSILLLAFACARPAPEPETAASEPRPGRVVPAEPLEPAPDAAEPEDREAAAEPVLPKAVETPAPPAAPAGPILLRVGLETDLEEARIACCLDGEMLLEGGGRQFRVRGPLTVRPDGESTGTGFFRLQVAALKDEGQAAELARRLSRRTGQPADAHFDAGLGLYRVRVGRYTTRGEAETARRGLEGRGVPASWIVSEGADVTRAALRVVPAGPDDPVRLAGRRLRLVPDSGVVRWGARRFRGHLLLYVNDRGTLNVVNELPLEDYLRSVVPSEMGPEIYDRPEALKAQAVAARTYVLRHLGEFVREGYDVCATPRCQVYRGVASEHPDSDRAVAATAGEVLLHDGEIVDARYSASCGGHTEDVAVVFPLERHTYLQGVPCPEAGPTSLMGTEAGGLDLEGLERRKAWFLALTKGGELAVRTETETRRVLPLSRRLATLQPTASGDLAAAHLDLVPGDRLTLYLDGGAVRTLVQEAGPIERAYRRRSGHASWTRFRSDGTLSRQVAARYPGLDFAGFEVLDRGVSGRVGKVRLLGRDGSSVDVEGLAVRWTLDVPDTRFRARRTTARDGRRGWLFTGSGWGHGVGLCQVGSVNLAGRGATYREILHHYYTGVELARVRSVPDRWDDDAPDVPPLAPAAGAVKR